LKSTLALTLKLHSVDVREGLASVLAPDNEGVPHGLRLSVGGRGAVMEFRIESDSPSTAISTILALLRDIILFQEVWLLSHGKSA
jgi:hypothetical protein